MTVELSMPVFLICILSTTGCGISNAENNCLQRECKLHNARPICILGCEDGWSGDFCQDNCGSLCSACKFNDSYTCTKCDKGRYGKTCSETCDVCVDNECHLNGTCIRVDQTGLSDKPCPLGCKHGSCDENGKCIHGCKDTFFGNACNQTCPLKCRGCDGSDDTNCSISCTGCKNMRCQNNGTCVSECWKGSTEDKCSVLLPNTSNSNDIWEIIWNLAENNDLFLPLLGCSLVLFMALTGILIWRCRGKKKETRPSREDSQYSFINHHKTDATEFGKCGDIYHEIDDKHLDPDPINNTRGRLLSARPPLPLPPNIHTGNQQVRVLPEVDQYMTAMDDFNAGGVGVHDQCAGTNVRASTVTVIIENDIDVSALDAQGYLTPGQPDCQ